MKILFTSIVLCLCTNLIFAQTSSQLFNKTKMEYEGDKARQAKQLMRKISIWGQISEKQAKLDSNYLLLLSTPIDISREKLKTYLKSNTISEAETGGSLDSDVSFIIHNSTKVYAKYFVIHDVSTPVYKNTFPQNINDDSWEFNNPQKWSKKVTHAYLTRTGKCKTVTNFSEGLRATKFELKILGTISRGLFIHIELIQPRRYPPGNDGNAPVAPNPGFTDIQYQKLALLYLCASVRKGDWLVPAFHANIDEKLNDGHDDPQNFETEKFTTEILKLVSALKAN